MTTAALDAPAPRSAGEVPFAALSFDRPRHDLLFYGVVPLALFAAMVPAASLLGPQGPLWVYLFNTVAFGLPHNMLTWGLLFPAEGRARYDLRGVLLWPSILTLALMVPTVLSQETPLFAWALSVNICLAYYHITRQHMGLLRMADGRYLQAAPGATVEGVGRPLAQAVAATAFAAFAWKATGGPMSLGVVLEPMRFAFWPVPAWLPAAATLYAAGALGWAGLGLWRLHRAGAPWPRMHLLLAGPMLFNLVSAAMLPNDAFYLTLALVSACHNLQYLGFVYTHHHLRTQDLTGSLDLLGGLARARRLLPYAGALLAAGIAYATFCTTVLPPRWGSACLMTFMTIHYFVDGAMWRRAHFRGLGEIMRRRVKA